MKSLGRKILSWLGVTIAATGLAFGLGRTDALRAVENIYYDYWHVITGVRYEPQHTAFVTMDDETLVALKDDPLAFWAPHFGQAMTVLTQAGVKAVGLDFIYQVSAEGWLRKLNLPDSEISRNYDSPLREALASGNKILITHLVDFPDGTSDLLYPPDDQRLLLPGGVNDLGIANLHPDDDKHVRRFQPIMDPNPKAAGVGFAMQLALRAAGKDPSQQQWEIAGEILRREYGWKSIGYTGPSGTIPTVSMNTLLKPGAANDSRVQGLKGKVVIIAAANK